MRDDNGNLSEAGSARILSNEIPSIIPDSGFKAGAWENSLNPADITFTKESETLTFKYICKSVLPTTYYTLTIDYVDDNGQTIADTYSHQYTAGSSYSVASPVRDGYTPDIGVVEGTINKTTTVTVTYTPSAETDVPIE